MLGPICLHSVIQFWIIDFRFNRKKHTERMNRQWEHFLSFITICRSDSLILIRLSLGIQQFASDYWLSSCSIATRNHSDVQLIATATATATATAIRNVFDHRCRSVKLNGVECVVVIPCYTTVNIRTLQNGDYSNNASAHYVRHFSTAKSR